MEKIHRSGRLAWNYPKGFAAALEPNSSTQITAPQSRCGSFLSAFTALYHICGKTDYADCANYADYADYTDTLLPYTVW